MEKLDQPMKTDWKNRIVWIIPVTVFYYMFVFAIPSAFLITDSIPPFKYLTGLFPETPDAVRFTVETYLSTLGMFLGVFLYTGITKRNRFIFRSFLPSAPGNTLKALMLGLLIGFAMNFACIVCALLNGDIKLYLSFAATEIPFFLFALVCVFIQSSSEELWCRGFMYERINVHYPLWVSIAVNGLFFALMHVFNPGASFLPIFGIFICGLSFSIAKWYTGSIWFPMGIHTAWNFTQNFLFGLPNSGLVSEASVFTLDAANARSSLVYDVGFGIEGGIPSVLADAVLGAVCLMLAARQGRLPELMQKQVTPGKDPSGPQPLPEFLPRQDEEAGKWRYDNIEKEENTDERDNVSD